MKSIFLSIFLIASFVVEAQSQFEDYKYIVVPKRFDNFKKENQYRSSTLIKYLFAEKGFNVIYEDKLPADINSDRCLGLFVNLSDTSSLFVTKLSIILEDCSGEEIFITEEGRSKEKDYQTVYTEVINEAFNSFDGLTHNYRPKKVVQEDTTTISSKNDIEKVDEVEDSMMKKEGPVTISFRNDIQKVDEKLQANKRKESMVKQEATLENQSYKDVTPLASDIKKTVAVDTKKGIVRQKNTESTGSLTFVEEVLYAQETPNGYQLVDSTPKIQLKLFKSSVANVYTAKGDGKDGVVYSKNEQWFFEYYENDKLVTERLKIKF